MASTTIGTAKIALVFNDKTLSTSIDKVSDEMDDAGKSSGSLFGKAWTVAAIDRISSGINKIATAAINVGKDILTTGMNFEAQMSKVSAISGATGNDLGALTDKALELASTSVFTTEQAGQGFEYMAMAGWKTSDMLDGLEGIMNLAAAAGEDLGITSDIVTDAITAFGLQASDSSHFADVLAAASSNANTNVSMLGESFKYVAPVAGALNYSVEDTSIALSMMANSGTKASEAGTALRSILSRMASPTSEVQAAMDKLGISLTDENGQMLDLWQVLDNVQVAFSGLNEVEKAQYASTIAGKNAMSGFLAIANSSTEDFQNLSAAIYNADGAAKQMADTMLDNLSGSITVLQSQWDVAKTSLFEGNFDLFGESIASMFESAIKIVQKVAPALVDAIFEVVVTLSKQLPELISTLTPVILNAVMDIIIFLNNNAGSILQGLINLIFSVVNSLIPRIPEFLLSVVDAIMGVLMTLTSPDNLQQLLNTATDLLMSIAHAIPAVVQELATTLPVVIEQIVTFLSDPSTISSLLEAAIEALMAIVDALPTIINALIEALPLLIQSAVDFLTQPSTLDIILNGAITLFKEIVNSLPTIITALAKALPKVIASIVDFLTNPSTIMTILNAAVELFFALVQAVPQILGALIGAFGSLVGSLWNGITQMFGAFASNFGEFIGGIFKGAINGVLAFIETIINGPIDIINGFIGLINGAFGWIGVNLGTISRINLPRLAEGGIAYGASAAIIGENGREAVLPLEHNTDNWAGLLATVLVDEMEEAPAQLDRGITIEKQEFIINNDLDFGQVERGITTALRRATI